MCKKLTIRRLLAACTIGVLLAGPPMALAQTHSGSIGKAVSGPNGDSTTPRAHVGDTVNATLTYQDTDGFGDSHRVDSMIDRVLHTSGAVDSPNLIVAPVTLTVGQTVTRSHSYTILATDATAAPHFLADENVVAGEDLGTGLPFSLTFQALIKVLRPAITITKTCELTGTPENPVITYTFNVCNTGDTDLYNVTVVDDNGTPGNPADDQTFTIGPAFPTVALAVGACVSQTHTYTATINPSINTVVAKGFDILGVSDPAGDTPENKGRVTATDDCTVTIPCNPAIDVTKTCTVVGTLGNLSVNYNGVVSNPGDVILHNVTVQDNKGGAAIPLGDIAPGGSAPYSGSYTLPADTACDVDVTDEVTATGTFATICPPVNGVHTVSDTASATCRTPPCPPSIEVVKEVVCANPNVPDPTCDGTLTYADSAAGVVGSAGDTRSFCYKFTITNTGQDVLNNVTLTDDVIGNITLPADGLTLDPGESTIAYASHSAPVGDNQVNTATASGHGAASNTDVSDTDTATVSVAYIAVECELQLSSADDQDNNPSDASLLLPTSFAGSCISGGAILTVRNTGQLTESVQLTETASGVTVSGCVDANGDPVDPSLPFDLASGASVTIYCDICDITCPGPDTISISVVASAIGNETYPCILDAEGNPVTTASDSCPGTVSCVQPTECRTTGGGTLYEGDSNENCVTVTTTLWPTSQNGLVLDHISHGGQLGAPFANKDCAEFLANPCIRGQWQHTRHYQGKGNPRHIIESNFHSNTPKGIFDTLKCECLGCCANEEGNSKKGPNGNFTGWDNFKFEVCNQDDHRVCGPVPRPAPANALIWSGVGTGKFITDTTTAGAAAKAAEWMIIRVYVEDRSEPGGFHPKGSIDPSDVYVFQAWSTGILVAKKADPNADAVLNALMPGQAPGGVTIKQFRAALSADSCAFLTSVSKTGTCPPGTLPPTAVAGIDASVYDQGPLRNGNRQIHPVTGATCSAGPGIPVNFDYPLPTAPYCEGE